MILPLAEFMLIAATCAPGIAAKDLQAFAKVESAYDTLAIGDNTEPKTYRAATLDEAVGTAKRLMAAGHSLDLGLMQINSANFNWLGLTIETAFDPCESLRAATLHLQATSTYNTGDKARGFHNGYVQRVLVARQNQSPRIAASAASDKKNYSAHKTTETPKSPHCWDVFAKECASRKWDVFAKN